MTIAVVKISCFFGVGYLKACLVSTWRGTCIPGQSYKSFVEINITLNQRLWSSLGSGLKMVGCFCRLEA